jgi:hypothetical protein
MGAWDLSNEIERVGYRLDSVKSIIELVAEKITDNIESSALYGAAEMIDLYIQKLELLSEEAMNLHRSEKVEKPASFITISKKGKKSGANDKTTGN